MFSSYCMIHREPNLTNIFVSFKTLFWCVAWLCLFCLSILVHIKTILTSGIYFPHAKVWILVWRWYYFIVCFFVSFIFSILKYFDLLHNWKNIYSVSRLDKLNSESITRLVASTLVLEGTNGYCVVTTFWKLFWIKWNIC